MRVIALTAAAFVLVGLASTSQASGVGSASPNPGLGSLGGADDLSQDRQIQRLYRTGRSQVRKYITCKECDFHRRLNKDTALEVAQNVVDGKYMIKEKDRTAVLLYLRDRYKL